MIWIQTAILSDEGVTLEILCSNYIVSERQSIGVHLFYQQCADVNITMMIYCSLSHLLFPRCVLQQAIISSGMY